MQLDANLNMELQYPTSAESRNMNILDHLVRCLALTDSDKMTPDVNFMMCSLPMLCPRLLQRKWKRSQYRHL